ncbi:MAG TPA: hypothetical protein GXX69_05310, partial [Firmicutes bacterium]|nr:hypothetical protein [Bacillota bacterium]
MFTFDKKAEPRMEVYLGGRQKGFGTVSGHFARIIGNRHHFLAGYGAETFLPPTKIYLHPRLCLFVEGKQ